MAVIHLCHAIDCNERVPPKLLMCAVHWHMVPHELRKLVWRTYVPGQEITKTPTAAYLEAAKAAINAVARLEGKPELKGTDEVIKTLELMLTKSKKTAFSHLYGRDRTKGQKD